MGAIWEKFDVDFRTLFGVHGTIVLCSSILSFFIWPDVPFDAQDYEKKNPTEQGMIPLSDDKPNHFSERVTRLHPIPFTAPDTKLFHQSLQSYLRSGSSLDLQRSMSFFQSRQAVETGDPSAIAKMSLKDLPFLKQVSSGSYARMTFMFTTTNFISNLYIASLATEVSWIYFLLLPSGIQKIEKIPYNRIMLPNLTSFIFVNFLAWRPGRI
jgi:hypothetical protein